MLTRVPLNTWEDTSVFDITLPSVGSKKNNKNKKVKSGFSCLGKLQCSGIFVISGYTNGISTIVRLSI